MKCKKEKKAVWPKLPNLRKAIRKHRKPKKLKQVGKKTKPVQPAVARKLVKRPPDSPNLNEPQNKKLKYETSQSLSSDYGSEVDVESVIIIDSDEETMKKIQKKCQELKELYEELGVDITIVSDTNPVSDMTGVEDCYGGENVHSNASNRTYTIDIDGRELDREGNIFETNPTSQNIPFLHVSSESELSDRESVKKLRGPPLHRCRHCYR